MAKQNIPTTQAVRELQANNIAFTLLSYRYQNGGGVSVAGAAAHALGLNEHEVVKTLVMTDEKGNPFLVLMHGDKQISTKALARELQVKAVDSCDPKEAQKHTGYMVGGISPFGTRKKMKVYVESSVLELPNVYINAGRRGVIASMAPDALIRVLGAVPVNVAI
jgi:Cys-tRNA(Pro) deacylase